MAFQREPSETDNNFVALTAGGPFKDHLLWDNKRKEWTKDFSKATVCDTYGDAGRLIWDIPQKKLNELKKIFKGYSVRITSLPVVVYQHYIKLIKDGKWNGIDDLPHNLDYGKKA